MLKFLIGFAVLIAVVFVATMTLKKGVVELNQDGEPFDWIGPVIGCPKCNVYGAECYQKPYHYRCPNCKSEYRARYHMDGQIVDRSQVEIDW